MNLLRTAAAVTMMTGSVGALAAPATAAPVDRESLSWPASDEVVATCEGGVEIGLGFDLTRNVHDRYNRDGELVRQMRNVVFVGYFERLDTHEQHRFHGSRVVTMDFVDGTFTSVGAYRIVTMPGEGAVFLEAGRYVEDLDVEGVFYAQSGPKFDEWDEGGEAVSCALFGLAAS